MLDFIGTIAITSTMVVCVNALITTAASDRLHRLGFAALAGAWIGLCVALGSIGQLADSQIRAVPLIGILFATPLIATAAAVWLVPGVPSALLALPMPLLIGLNGARLFGGFFLLLAAAGRLGGPFPFSAGWGDVITGVLALPVAILAARGAWRGVFWWNAFGMLDLVAAVILGVVSSPGSPLQLIHAGPGSAAVQHLPWALIPTVLVPFYLIVHGIIFAQLRNRADRVRRVSGQPTGELA